MLPYVQISIQITNIENLPLHFKTYFETSIVKIGVTSRFFWILENFCSYFVRLRSSN
jgi:hypothetical protein